MNAQVGDMAFIGGNHHGYAKGKTGKVIAKRGDGRMIVQLKGGYKAFVRPQNLKPFLDVFKEGDEK